MGKIDKMEEEKKIGAIRMDYKEKPIVSPTFGKFPVSFWLDWEKDCEQNYNGTRWMKAWNDHQKAKQSMKEEAMWAYMMKLNDRVDDMESNPIEQDEEDEKDEDFVATLGNPTPKKKKGKVM